MLSTLPRKITAGALTLAATIGATVAITGGNSTRTVTTTVTSTAPPAVACPDALHGHGAAGACAPASILPNTRIFHPAGEPGPRYPDLSNNDPCVCGAKLKAQGYQGLIVKANQGTGFIDSWAVPMVASARAAGLAVGAYDFDQDYTVAEAQTFVSRLHAMGILPNTRNTFPAYLDVEFGNFNYGGLLAQIAYLRHQGYRVGIYTGEWYWGPHAGSTWPAGVSAWISGYPFAPAVPGLPSSLYNAHQFTDTPFDISVFRGPGTFASFVQSAPAGPSKATLNRLRDDRNKEFTAYHKHGCRYPQQDRFCRYIGGAVIKVQNILWNDQPHSRWACFGSRSSATSRRSMVCWVVRPQVAYWSHARDSSRRAFDNHVCGGATGTQGLTKNCRVWKQRATWFGEHASATVKEYGRT